ncbi:carboxymuconolactone decarboxylase family protein [Paenibacillaceae bacterium WGS1546]|uniref:carboxymuconolactone decarboxylase family protein n=1 Tax=Cohnella sp. WGS1546 TaxID=3366810 RepID=UPI00372D7076
MTEREQRAVREAIASLTSRLPGLEDAYDRYYGRSFEEGQLDGMTKQMIGLGVALLANDEGCAAYYAQEARALGASDAQLAEAVAAASAAASGLVLMKGARGALPGTYAYGQASDAGAEHENPLRHLQLNAFQDTEFSEDEGPLGLANTSEGWISPSY